MERFEQRTNELRAELDAIGEAVEKNLSNDETSILARVVRAGADLATARGRADGVWIAVERAVSDAASRAAGLVTEHLGVTLDDPPGPIGENLTRIEHGLVELKRKLEKAEAANERLRAERERWRAKSPQPTPAALPRVKLTRAGGYDPAKGKANRDQTLEKPSRRGATVDVAVGTSRQKHPGGKAARRTTTRRKGGR